MTKFIICLLALCVASFAGAAEAAAAAEAKVPDITHEELAKAVAAKQAVVIDVNGTESFKAGHIPGAIDFQAEKDALAAKLPKDKAALVVAYCGGPSCGAYKQAANAAVALGYTNVKHYSAGISGWKEKGATLEKVEASKQN